METKIFVYSEKKFDDDYDEENLENCNDNVVKDCHPNNEYGSFVNQHIRKFDSIEQAESFIEYDISNTRQKIVNYSVFEGIEFETTATVSKLTVHINKIG